MRLSLALVALLLQSALGTDTSSCSTLSKSDCKHGVGHLIGCIWESRACHAPADAPPADCSKLSQNKCRKSRDCMYVAGDCKEGGCYLAKDSPLDCKATGYCALQLPHGMMKFRDYHRKVNEECLDIEERMELEEDDYEKLDINRFCDANNKRRDCLRPRYLAFPERLRYQLETDVCQWNYNQEVCRVNRVGAQYGAVVNTTVSTLRQENPDYIIVDKQTPPKNKFFTRRGELWDTFDSYNEMCYTLSEDEHILGKGCEERGCALFFDESKFDVTTRTLTDDAVYCVPRFPLDAAYGSDPNAVKNLAHSGDSADDVKFFFDSVSHETIQEWIGYLLCDYVHPKYCNSIPGCNSKKDKACSGNGSKCYICTGEPEVGGKRRLELDHLGLTEDEQYDLIWDYLHPGHREFMEEVEALEAEMFDN